MGRIALTGGLPSGAPAQGGCSTYWPGFGRCGRTPGQRPASPQLCYSNPQAPLARLDGVAELHFRTVVDLRERMYDSEEGKARIRADVKTFIDVPAGWRMMATERILTTPPH